MKAVITFLMMISVAYPSWATVTVGVEDCPIQFEGRVKEIIEPVGATDYLSTSKVVFETERTLKGEVGEQVLLNILQNGPFKVEAQKEYRVKLRNGKLCWIEEI